MTLYGLLGFTHNGGRTLTVMSPEGASAALAAVEAGAGDDVAVQAGAGQLTHYLERRRGGLQRLIAAQGIVVLDKPAWDAKKTALGPSVFN